MTRTNREPGSDSQRTGRTRYTRHVLRLFPQTRRNSPEEMIDALELEAGVHPIRQGLWLLWAAAIAWRRELCTARALHQAAWAGAVIWLSLLVAIGPVLRASMALGPVGSPPGYLTSSRGYVLAAALLIAGLLLHASRSVLIGRWLAAVVAGAGIVGAALTGRIGEFQFLRAFLYELRWLGLALVLVLVLKPARAWRWPPVVGHCCAMGFLYYAVYVESYQGYRPLNYRFFLRSGLWELIPLGQSNAIDLVVVLVLVALVTSPFFAPAVSAFFVVPMAGMFIVPQVRDSPVGSVAALLVLAGYLALAALWHFRRPIVAFDVDRDPAGRRRLAISWSTKSTR